ncbi:MAG: SPFH domain-containing protein [Sandaracinaceae bacterium]
MVLVLVCVFALGLLGAPIAAAAAGFPLGLAATLALTSVGSLLLLLVGALVTYQRLYKKTRANEAFVRTGRGGVSVIRDGGAFVVPFLHELIEVTLTTLKLRVTRKNEDALITQDKLRADIEAEFFVRVQPDEESILQASRSLGDRMGEPEAVKELVEDKLVSALRTAAAGKTLEQLNSERDEFLTEVMKLVGEDLRANGLILETVTISRLDQTDDKFLKAENIFDAQGRRKIAEITQINLTERNRLVREGERQRKLEDVQTRQEVLSLEQKEQEAEARTLAEVQKIKADTERAAMVERITAERKVALAAVDKQKALELASREQEEAVEVAERAKQQKIARAEQERAAAEAELANTEAEREAAQQKVETVRVTQEAERAKAKSVIDAEAEAERAFVAEQRRADANAYSVQKQAEAQMLSADAESTAIRKKASAEAEAARQRAEGMKATEMVPVEVEKAKVELDRDRIETVVKPELAARERHGKVAQDFELAKLRIEAERTVHIAMAEAQAKLFSKMEANLYGTPEDVTKIMNSLTKGQSVAKGIEGFLSAADDTTKGGLTALTQAVMQRLQGEAPKAEVLPADVLAAEALPAAIESEATPAVEEVTEVIDDEVFPLEEDDAPVAAE